MLAVWVFVVFPIALIIVGLAVAAIFGEDND